MPVFKMTKVTFRNTDGVNPKKSNRQGGPFELFSPIDINTRGTKSIKLGVFCNLPVIVQSFYGSTCEVIPAGAELHTLIVTGGSNMSLSRGELVATCFVIDNTNVEIA